MGLGLGELVVLVALGAVVLLGLMIGMWLLRKTLSLVKRLVMASVVVGVFLLVAVAGAVGFVWMHAH